jgi:hypothetical protein
VMMCCRLRRQISSDHTRVFRDGPKRAKTVRKPVRGYGFKPILESSRLAATSAFGHTERLEVMLRRPSPMECGNAMSAQNSSRRSVTCRPPTATE